MLEFKILQAGLILHLVIQIYYGVKLESLRANGRILWSFILTFVAIGSVLTVANMFSDEDFGVCGTKRFNPFIIIVLWGNLLNLVVVLVSNLILKISQRVKSFNK